MRRLYGILSVLLFAVNGVTAQRVSVRFPELMESNAEYRALCLEVEQLQRASDSLALVKDVLRQKMREDPNNGNRYKRQVMEADNRELGLNISISQHKDRIFEIEQEWELSSLKTNRQLPTRQSPASLPDSAQHRNLVYNRPFEVYMTRQDYTMLKRAQEREALASQLFARYTESYFTIRDLVEQHDTTDSETQAIELYDRIHALNGQNQLCADSLAQCWQSIYGDKEYAYNFVLETLHQESLLDEQEQRKLHTQREINALQGRTTSDALTDYILRKRTLVAYESAVADVLGLRQSADSLKWVEGEIAAVCDQICALPPIVVKPRTFIEYDSLVFASRPQYSDKKPYPECKVYQRGTIFRILLATYSINKPTYSTFRNTAPIFELRSDDGKTRYFAGGFATEEEAIQAQAQLKKRGFRSPEICVWIDGVYRNLTQAPLPTATLSGFRLEISNIEQVTDAMRAALSVVSTTAEISRAGSLYIIGTFEERSQAEQAVTALHGVDPTLQIKVIELSIPASSAATGDR